MTAITEHVERSPADDERDDELDFECLDLSLRRQRSIPLDDFIDLQAPWSIELTKESEDESRHHVGEATILEFRGAREKDFFDACDAIDAEVANLAAAITSGGADLPDEFWEWPMLQAVDILVISHLTIAPPFRGFGLGAQLVDAALDSILGDRLALVFAYPAPFESLDDADAWARVRRFWEAAGFVHAAGGVAVKPYLGSLVREVRPKHLREFVNEWQSPFQTPWPEPDLSIGEENPDD